MQLFLRQINQFKYQNNQGIFIKIHTNNATEMYTITDEMLKRSARNWRFVDLMHIQQDKS